MATPHTLVDEDPFGVGPSTIHLTAFSADEMMAFQGRSGSVPLDSVD